LELLGQQTDQDPDYFTKWLAQLFKHPGSKPITSPVITSVQGTGKNSFFDFIGKMMGDELYCETADPDNVLFGRFSSAIERCKFVFIDEMESGTGFKNSAKLKALITNDHHTVEKKGLDAYKIKNYAAIGFASNNPCPVKVEGSDRRFFSYCPKKILDQTFFDNWRVWTKDPQNARAVYDYLMEQDIKGVDWIKDRPMNAAYAEMKYAALPSMIKWLDHLITEDFPTSWACEGRQVDSGALYENYRSWGHNQEKSTVQFGKAIKTLIDKEGLVGIEKGIRTNSGIRYTINQDQVHGWLKSKGYTLSQ
jgi:phage/plasmid-associated DNA primase